MTIGEWLASREPRPPAELLSGIEAAIGSEGSRDVEEGTAVFLTAAERLLRELVSEGETGRPIATRLLVIDGLTTYAMEIAAETLKNYPGVADDAVAQFARLLQHPKPTA